MRARQRHINLKAFGPQQSYDARFESYSNSSAINVWKNRVSPGTGDATQTTENLKPTFSLRAINGSAAINFSGSNYLNMPVASSSDIEIYVLGNHSLKAWSGNYLTSLQAYIDQNHSTTGGFVLQTRPDLSSTRMNFNFQPPNLVNAINVIATTNNLFTASRIRGGDTFTWTNGDSKTIVTGTQNWVARANQIIGAWYNSGSIARYLTGNIGFIALFNKLNSDAVRRRIERGIAFSFKIPCS